MNFVIGLKALSVKCKIDILALTDAQSCVCEYIVMSGWYLKSFRKCLRSNNRNWDNLERLVRSFVKICEGQPLNGLRK